MKKFLFGILGLLFAVPAVADLDPCRNLFDKNASYALFNGYLNNVSVGQSTNLNAYSGGDKTIIIKVAPNTTYTVTRATNLGSVYDRIRCAAFKTLPSGGSTGVILYNNMNTTQANATFTTLSDTQYVAINVRNSGAVGNDWTQFVDAFQLEEGSTATEYVPFCANQIKIATTVYNTARFSPVVTELNDTIATIRSVVTNTINQTKAIADLQATKQTRPDETCPAGKKCLLVEDDAGQPHWYEIIESASRLPDGFTELQYIESTGTQYIDTGISTGTNIELKYKFKMTIAPANNGYASVLACRTSANSNSISQGLQSNKFFFGFGNNSEASQSMTVLNKDITVIQNKNQITINNEPYNYQNGYTTTFTDTSMLYLFARNNIGMGAANFFTGRVYYAQIYNNGALVRDFVPAKNSSGVIGMYDLADTNPATAFHTNAGSGTFVAGPAVQ